MNICYLVSNIDPFVGGTERVTMSVAENLQKNGYDTYFVYTKVDNESILTERKIKIEYECATAVWADRIVPFIKRNKIKILIVINRVFQTPKFQRLYQFLKENTDVQIVASLHAAPDNWVNKDKWGMVFPKIYLKNLIKSVIYKFNNPHKQNVVGTYQIVDKYLLLSESYLKPFMDIYKIKDGGEKLIAIPNPCPFESIRHDYQKDKQVLIVSRMEEDQKRIWSAIQIWSEVGRKYPDWKLVIVGDGPDFLSYKRIAADIQNISFVGHSNKVQDYYKKSMIFMMTSSWEGLPMTLIEAMSYGCVPIAFDSFAALHDVIVDSENGCIIEHNNKDLFVEKLGNLMGDGYLWNYMSDKVYCNSDKFRMETIIELWKSTLCELCER